MKKKMLLLPAALLLTTLFAAQAQPPAGAAKVGDNYGAPVTMDKAISASQLLKELPATGKIQTKITAKVLDVCPKKGCWVRLAVNDSVTAFVKMKEYAYFVPTALIGKNVVLDGSAELKSTSVSELRHYAEDANKSEAEIAAITKPETEIRIVANGIKVIK